MKNEKIIMAEKKFYIFFKQIEDELGLRLNVITKVYSFEDFEKDTEIDFKKKMVILREENLLSNFFPYCNEAMDYLKQNDITAKKILGILYFVDRKAFEELDSIDLAQELSKIVNYKKLLEKEKEINKFLRGLRNEIFA